jgi:hypothetical protein
MGKANISFPDGMLEEVDRRAAARGTTRSGFIQEATACYMAVLEHDAEQASRRQRVKDAQARMAEIGRAIPSGPDGVTVLRQMRDALPRWLAERTDHAND